MHRYGDVNTTFSAELRLDMPHVFKVAEDERLLRIEATRNDIASVLFRECEGLLSLQLVLEKELFVVFKVGKPSVGSN